MCRSILGQQGFGSREDLGVLVWKSALNSGCGSVTVSGHCAGVSANPPAAGGTVSKWANESCQTESNSTCLHVNANYSLELAISE